MIVTIDVGNTTVATALMSAGSVIGLCKTLTSNFDSQKYQILLAELMEHAGLSAQDVDAAVVCCVVPGILSDLTKTLNAMLQKPCFLVQPGIAVGMKIAYEPVGSLGADRIANSVATREISGFPSISIDFGTATTFCVLDRQGDFCGGSIVPGLKAFGEILGHTTSKLPVVDFVQTTRVIGQSTLQNLQSGLFFGYIAMIEGLLKHILNKTGDNTKVVATGGYCNRVCPHIKGIDLCDEHLTMKGLEILYRMNHPVTSSKLW